MYSLHSSVKDKYLLIIILVLSGTQFEKLGAQNCLTSPVITCPPIYNGCIQDDISPESLGFATALPGDNNCPDPIVSWRDSVMTDYPCGSGLKIKRLWKAVYPDSLHPHLVAECTQVIVLKDDVSPVLENCPQDIVIDAGNSCNGSFANWIPPIASDICGLQSFTSTHEPGDLFPKGTTTVTYTAIDYCGNTATCSFHVIVEANCCNSTPVLTLPDDFTGCPGEDVDPLVTGTATAQLPDGCGIPLLTFVDSTTNDGHCAGEKVIQRTWTASHPTYPSLMSSGVQWISLLDSEAPVLMQCPENVTVQADENCIAIVDLIPPLFTDNCTVASLIVDRSTGSGSEFSIGTTTITYTAVDGCGNSSSCSVNVTVLGTCCNEPPIINCPPDFVGCPGSSIHPSITGMATINAGYSCTPTITYNDVYVPDSSCISGKVIDRLWIAEYDGYSDTCIQRISLITQEGPVIDSCVSDVTLSFNNRNYTWNDPPVTSPCNYSIAYSTPKGSTFPVGDTEVKVTVSDECGKETSCVFVVTVLPDNSMTSLIVTCPDDLVLDCDSYYAGPIPIPDVSTDCAHCVQGDIPGFVFMGSRGGHNYYCSRDKMTWPEAQAFCESNGGYLAVIDDAGENHFLAGILRTNAAYIGLSDHRSEGHFEWVNGSPVSFTKWYPRQPNNYANRQDYVELLRNGYWNDQYNDKPLEFIMEVPCVSIVQTSGPSDLSTVEGNATVVFEISDACGNSEICSYDISIDNEVELNCPQDISLTSSNRESIVYFDSPSFTTCCSNCGHGQPIPGFVYMGHKNGSYYYCSKDKATWHKANEISRKSGGHLAIISDSHENNFLANILNTTIAFIGVSDHENEGVWKDVNGNEQQYFNWRSGNPNNYEGNQHYVELEPSGKWNDNSGTYKREFIMEIRGCGLVKQTSGIPSGGFFPEGTTTVSFEARDKCGNIKTCSFDVTIDAGAGYEPNYCDSYAKNSNRAYIKKVQINDVLFHTGNNGGYKGLLDHCPVLRPGEKFYLKVSPGYPYYRYYAYYKIYVDYNGDGDFIDHGEYVGKAKSIYSVAGKIPVPPTATPGTTRMRIVMSLTGYEDACSVYYYGETEDYCVTIGQGDSYQAPAKGGNKSIQWEPVSLSEEIEKHDVVSIIWPNPAHEFLIIENNQDIRMIEIFGIDGSRQMKLNDPEGRIDVSNIPPGLYLIRMIDKFGFELSEKIVIN